MSRRSPPSRARQSSSFKTRLSSLPFSLRPSRALFSRLRASTRTRSKSAENELSQFQGSNSSTKPLVRILRVPSELCLNNLRPVEFGDDSDQEDDQDSDTDSSYFSDDENYSCLAHGEKSPVSLGKVLNLEQLKAKTCFPRTYKDSFVFLSEDDVEDSTYESVDSNHGSVDSTKNKPSLREVLNRLHPQVWHGASHTKATAGERKESGKAKGGEKAEFLCKMKEVASGYDEIGSTTRYTFVDNVYSTFNGSLPQGKGRSPIHVPVKTVLPPARGLVPPPPPPAPPSPPPLPLPLLQSSLLPLGVRALEKKEPIKPTQAIQDESSVTCSSQEDVIALVDPSRVVLVQNGDDLQVDTCVVEDQGKDQEVNSEDQGSGLEDVCDDQGSGLEDVCDDQGSSLEGTIDVQQTGQGDMTDIETDQEDTTDQWTGQEDMTDAQESDQKDNTWDQETGQGDTSDDQETDEETTLDDDGYQSITTDDQETDQEDYYHQDDNLEDEDANDQTDSSDDGSEGGYLGEYECGGYFSDDYCICANCDEGYYSFDEYIPEESMIEDCSTPFVDPYYLDNRWYPELLHEIRNGEEEIVCVNYWSHTKQVEALKATRSLCRKRIRHERLKEDCKSFLKFLKSWKGSSPCFDLTISLLEKANKVSYGEEAQVKVSRGEEAQVKVLGVKRHRR